jgi:hypothetical protein
VKEARRCDYRTEDETGASDVGRDLLDQLQHFADERRLQCGKSCDIAAGPREARHDALLDWIRDAGEDDRDGLGLLL